MELTETTQMENNELFAPVRDFLSNLNLAGCTYPVDGTTFDVIVREFVVGTGIPCPGLMQSAPASLGEGVNLQDAHQSDFRTKILIYAACGHLNSSWYWRDNIIRTWNGTDRSLGWPGVPHADTMVMAHAGKIAFNTSSALVEIPTAHLDVLSTATYDGVAEPKNLRQALHHWLFSEIIWQLAGNQWYN
ncbi:hypothetical protein SISSUDRAFT_1065239 [Sistotremastrum suecicum HHB10207 ss-3]|uniref:Uncharacterized protein n=1 Tax=Sistotremastrum suecicum HHB10207 ss-3 TaxID=1314776 RepID=A0A165ZR96_9AGAM|nr:hypothetical protein SISSUDRAFT_1065239 [Sistotremastrum suecicum HHB10207 ss-3]